MSSIAVMQPYFFPYIGYFQLISAVEKFVFYDDVNYINRGWINRNRMLINNNAKYFTIPCKDASQNRIIKNVKHNLTEKKRKKLLRKFQFSYGKAPYFENAFSLFKMVIETDTQYISDLAIASIKEVCDFLGINCPMVRSSETYENADLAAAQRLMDICQEEESKTYVNPIGGKSLYEKNKFAEEGISLYFLKSKEIMYEQFGEGFVPWLSILDVLMFNPPEKVRDNLLESYMLI